MSDDDDFLPVQTADITASESRLLDQLIDASKHNDWNRFVSLTEQPFPNDESMKLQFAETSKFLRTNDNIELVDTNANVVKGMRVLTRTLAFTESGNRCTIQITLTRHPGEGYQLVLFHTMADGMFN